MNGYFVYSKAMQFPILEGQIVLYKVAFMNFL